MIDERRAEASRPRNRRAVIQRRGGVDRRAAVLDAPGADDVEVLEREAERIDHFVARRARRILPVLLHALAHRQRLCRPRHAFVSSSGAARPAAAAAAAIRAASP